MCDDIHSLRMRASLDGVHLSGAERLIDGDGLEAAALTMLQRALEHPRGRAERITLQVEQVPRQQMRSGCLPDLSGYQVGDWSQGRLLAQQLLTQAGVAPLAVSRTIETLAGGAAPDGTSMRGAMLVDAASGERLEADRARGVRASRMDLSDSARGTLRARLAEFGLDNPHVVEALTLAAKVLSAPGMVAELCWSDDPDYLAGYVASPQGGYQRIDRLKPKGEERGGRAFFIRSEQVALPELVDYLERSPLLIEQLGEISPGRPWPEVL